MIVLGVAGFSSGSKGVSSYCVEPNSIAERMSDHQIFSAVVGYLAKASPY